MPHHAEVCSRNLLEGEDPQHLPEATGAGEGAWSKGLIHSFISVQKRGKHTSPAPAELGFLSVSKEEFQPLVTWQGKGIK